MSARACALEDGTKFGGFAVVGDGLQQRLARIAEGVEVSTLCAKHRNEGLKIAWTHAAIRVQQDAVVRVGVISHWRFAKKRTNPFFIPNFINYFGFVRSHILARFRFRCL